MSRTKKIILAASALLCASLFWFWWNQPKRVDMAAYVPADALIYLEANSLPDIAQSVVSTDAWKIVAPAAGIPSDYGKVDWATRFAGLTGIGSGESVVFARAQVAVCILGFSASESDDATLKIAPRGAVVVETHTSGWRVRGVVEKSVGNFARRSFGETRATRTEEDGTTFFTWVARDDERKRLVAAVSGSLAVIGNDDASVRACLATKRGERPSLASEQDLKEMRTRMGGESLLAFGYAPAGSAAKVAEATAPIYVGQASEEPRVQSLLFDLIPKLAHRTIGSAAWGARFEEGAFLDSYLLHLPPSLTTRLAGAAIIADAPLGEITDLLPSDTSRVTFYNYQNPEAAWLALNAGLSTQVDAPHAPMVTLALESLLEPYGIESPLEFLRAAQPELLTARIGQTGEGKVIILGVRDRETMLGLITKRLGAASRTERIGENEMMIAEEAEALAASFVANYLILGRAEDVRACLSARAENNTLTTSEHFKAAKARMSGSQPHVQTFTSNTDAVSSFVLHFARRRGGRAFNQQAFAEALARLPDSYSETRITANRWERRTRSSFGLFGTIFTRFASDNNRQEQENK